MESSIIFCKSFNFNLIKINKYRHTDNSNGILVNYFAYMKKGNAKLCTEKETVTVNEGDIFFIPNGCRYHSYWFGEPEIEFISLGFVFLPNFENRNFKTQVIKRDEEAIKLMEEIINSPLNAVSVGMLYTLAGILLPQMSFEDTHKNSAIMDKAKVLILSSPQLTIKEIAKKCAVSESSLYSIFKKYSKKSILELKKEAIMKKAKELLITTDLSIEEISENLNFSSSAYFRKCFKEHFEMTPRDCRKNMSF